jgi:hypothetical protein
MSEVIRNQDHLLPKWIFPGLTTVLHTVEIAETCFVCVLGTAGPRDFQDCRERCMKMNDAAKKCVLRVQEQEIVQRDA